MDARTFRIESGPTDHSAVGDKRRHPRKLTTFAAKIRRASSGRYYAGTVCNLSAGGALLQLDLPITIRPGEQIAFGTARHARDVLIAESGMVEAVVLRGVIHDGHAHLALRFLEEASLALSA